MKLLVGIGNPGTRFADTRHNIGFRVLEAFASKHRIAILEPRFEGRFGRADVAGVDVGLLEPLTFVNRSGLAVQAALAAFPELDFERDLALIYDDLDLPFGRVRVRAAGGAGGHRGVANVIEALQSQSFARLRFGIGRPPDSMSIRDYVLEKFSAAEETRLGERIAVGIQALEAWLADGADAAMSRFNRESLPED